MIKIRNLVKTYRPKKGIPVHALNNVSLDINESGLVFILGKSGSGKSTLLNLLGGLDKYDSGDILIKGKSTRDFKQSEFDSYRNTYVGFIFQEYNILDDFSVGANIALAIELQGRKASDYEVSNILEMVDLAGYGSRRTNELSGGQKQRIAIARALVKDPDIILADEPSGALDSETGNQIFDTLKKLSKDKLVIVVSHDRETALKYGDRIIEFSDGKIINDIERAGDFNTTGEKTIKFDSKEGLLIDQGYKLTPKDLTMINEYLESNPGLMLKKTKISADEVVDPNSFVPTNLDNLSSNQNYGEFKMIKSKLPFKMAFRMGASGLNHKKFRLLFTILLSLVSFTLFAISDSMASYNKVDATTNSIIDSNIDYAAFDKTVQREVDYGGGTYIQNDKKKFDDAEISKINEDLKGNNVSFKGVYSGSSNQNITLTSNFNIFQSERSPYYLNMSSGFIEVSQTDLSGLGFTVFGRLAQNDNEVAIPQYIFEHFKEFGYNNNGNIVEAVNINNHNDIIGKVITIPLNNDSIDLTITGVIDTKIDEGRYAELKQPNFSSSTGNMLLVMEFNSVISQSYHSVLFVGNGFVERNRTDDSDFIDIYNANSSYLLEYGSNSIGYSSINILTKYSTYKTHPVVFFNTDKTSLATNEIIITFNDFQYLYPIEFTYTHPTGVQNLTLSDHERIIINEGILDYAESNLSEAKIYYEDVYEVDPETVPETELTNSYYNYITSNDPTLNNYGDSYEQIRYDMWNTGKLDNLVKTLNNIKVNKSVWDPYEGEIKSLTTVVGVTFNDDLLNGEIPLATALMSDTEFTTFKENIDTGVYKFILAPMPTNRSQVENLAVFSYELHNDDTIYTLQNSVTPMLDMANSLVENVAKVFLYIGIGFALFSALMLSNFIATSVARKKREIGILRALGARSNDVFKIFFNESLIIGIINFLIASVVSYFVISIINSTLREQGGFQITIFSFGIRQVVLLLGISLLVALIASYIPVQGIARKRPVDAISNK